MASHSRFIRERTAPLERRGAVDLFLSRRWCRRSLAGFTMIEVLVTTAIAAVLVSLGLFISLDFYRIYAFRAEQNIVVGLLEKARSQALANIGEQPHGLALLPSQYVVFEGASYLSADHARDEAVPANPNIPHVGLAEIVFGPLTGDVTAVGSVTLTDGVRTNRVSVNSEGQIEW